MKCLPHGGFKRKVSSDSYDWCNKDGGTHSFNDQPAYALINFSMKYYQWTKHGEWAYRYGKPIALEIVYEDVIRMAHYINQSKCNNFYEIEEVHLDYKDIYKNYCANMESKN